MHPNIYNIFINNTRTQIVIFVILVLQGCANHVEWRVKSLVPSRTGVAVQSVKINPFSGVSEQEGIQFARLLTNRLQHQGYVKIQSNGAKGLLSGNLTWGRTELETWSERFDIDGKTSYQYFAQKRKPLTVSYDFYVNDENYPDSYTKNYSLTQVSSNSYSEAKASLDTEQEIRSWLMTVAVYKIVGNISPHKKLKTYKLKLGDTDNLELGTEYVLLDRLDQALSIFRQIANKSNNKEDRASAVYNQGVIHEVRGDFKKAFSAYRTANQLHPEELMYPESVTRIEEEILNKLILDSQIDIIEE